MRLEIGPNIGNNKVRLDFKRSPDRPDNIYSYEIDKSKADEFVKKYNAQERKLLDLTILSVAFFAVIGWFAAMRKKSFVWAVIGIPAGVITGLGLGALVSSYKKNNLMDKYDVRQAQKPE